MVYNYVCFVPEDDRIHERQNASDNHQPLIPLKAKNDYEGVKDAPLPWHKIPGLYMENAIAQEPQKVDGNTSH